MGVAAAATCSGKDSASSIAARTTPGTGPAEPNDAVSSPSARSASETTEITIALRGPTFMKVSRAGSASTETSRMSSSSASALRLTPTTNSCSDVVRSPRTLAMRTCAPATSSGGSASPAGDEVPRFPPIVPRLRICGPPTVRDASASAGSGACIASVYVSPAPSVILPFARDHPRRSATSLRFSNAAGRARSKLSSTMTSVPPWIGTAPGTSVFSRSASSSVRGVRTSTARRVVASSWMDDLARRLAVARGDEPADVVVRGGRVLSVFTREWLDVDIAIADGWIAGLGDYEGREVVDAAGRYVVPGFIDAHMHLESTKLLPDEFARLVLPRGTTAVVLDPHELANVLGTDGVHWLLDACEGLPLDYYFMASSTIPASEFESPRRPLLSGDLESLLRRRRVLGLGEMMNFPGVINADPGELEKLALANGVHVDGHAPGVRGRALNAYVAAGIRSDHEALTADEGRQRLRNGMWLLIREASMARNLQALLPLVHEFGTNRIAFCTDDRDPEDIAENGHINGMLREAVASGIAAEDAVVLATINPATWHRLWHLGAIAPGYQADLLLLPDLESFEPEVTLKFGRPVEEIPEPEVPEWVKHSVRNKPVRADDLRIDWPGGNARVIGLVPDQVVTELLEEEPGEDGATIAVGERHLGTGRIGLGFVRGSGLQRGALASTVAHDAHNIIVIGKDADDMSHAVQRLGELGGGIVVVDGGGVTAGLPLPVAGLLADAPLADVIRRSLACNDAARALGWSGATPFLTLAFLGLSVIPSLKITDRGLVDVDRFELVPLAV